MLDMEFMTELKAGNKELLAFLDIDKILDVADYLIQEPKFSDSP